MILVREAAHHNYREEKTLHISVSGDRVTVSSHLLQNVYIYYIFLKVVCLMVGGKRRVQVRAAYIVYRVYTYIYRERVYSIYVDVYMTHVSTLCVVRNASSWQSEFEFDTL